MMIFNGHRKLRIRNNIQRDKTVDETTNKEIKTKHNKNTRKHTHTITK